MRRKPHRFPAIGAVVLAFLTLLASCPYTVFAEHGTTVTVAYIDYHNFLNIESDGTAFGYGADYLNRIAKYTGWSYEFVEMDWPTAYEKVKQGEVDFYCVARRTDEREPDFDFSLYPICNEEMNLYATPGKELYYEDYSSFDGKKVGMLKGSDEIAYFKQYEADHDFQCEIIEYPMNETAVTAMQNGEVDMIALVNHSVSDSLKLIGNFGVSPAHLMSCENSAYMAEFSKAQEKLFFDDPTYVQSLERQYYSEAKQSTELMLTREEADYLKSAKQSGEPIPVALSVDMAPIEYFDEATQTFQGITVDLYTRIYELTGLNFCFVRREDAQGLIAGMERGEVVLVGALAQSREVEKKLHVTQSKPFTENTFSLVSKDISRLSPDSMVAIPAGYPQFKTAALERGYTQFIECATFEDCVRAVNDDKADLTFIISMSERYLLDHVVYSDLQSMICSETNRNVCLGVDAQYDERLLSVINQCVSIIADHEVNEIILCNTAIAQPEQSFVDFLHQYSTALFVMGLILVALIAVSVFRAQKARQQKMLNVKLRQHHEFLQHLYDTLPCGVFQYTYEAPHTILSYNAACARIYGYLDTFPVVGETPDLVVEAGTEAEFQKKFDECEKAAGQINYTWPITRQDGTQAFTESVMDLVQTDQGKVFQEVILDVTERVEREKKVEKMYLQELHRKNHRDQNLLYTACFDVTEQRLCDTDIDVPGIHEGMSVSEFVNGLRPELDELQTKEAMEDFSMRFAAARLEQDYEKGHYEDSFDLCRRKDGQIQWLRSDLALRRNPTNDHLMCFDYIWDVTDERVTNSIARRMAFADCENFMSVYLRTGRCLQYEVGASGELTRTEAEYGKNDLLHVMSEQMTGEDAADYKTQIALCEVEAQLETNSHYQVYATLYGETKRRLDKSLTFFYTNQESGVLAVTVSDVTEVRAGEVRRAQLLADALAAAEKADAAKSQFLSRVSHEMRTPLNAIIGFIELAKDADAGKVESCLASSDLAAKQLLNVINDVLDMSSIESGKMKISNASFHFKHLITSIANIYGVQCKQKGIAFQVRMTTPLDDWLVGDELRVNQILMNLLGNAVKFTENGSIHLTISQMTEQDQKVYLRFVVSDTGCGMSEQMKARLFHPFEQESALTARKYGGNGLGMSIVKSLVGMMEGAISVQSVQGEGTAFTVDLPFGKSEVTEQMALPEKVESMHILTVDDEPAEREYMSLVLERMGVRFTSVCGGEEALKALSDADDKQDPYNICLIDWRMPGMNGCETTKRIRKKYGKELLLIVVSAFDFEQAGETATQAGANLFLSKPIFQSSLFDLFMTLTNGEIAKPKDTPQVWDFTGKRVLLAEDNTLNQLVAKGYLAKYHVSVDLAENGEKAVECFTQSQPGFYDAILMDVQMPVMDGFEATKAIRASAHAQAKTIPIIAQSADAFHKDIAKCLSAGMNAHVAKPIKPDILAKALYQAFFETVQSE